MEVALPHTPHQDWPFLNHVCHHKGIFLLSQATHADGITIRQSCLTKDPGLESNMIFPKQQPTAANFEVWHRTLYTISSPALCLGVPLSWFRRLPYDCYLWHVSRERSIVVCVDTRKEITILYLPSTTHTTHQGRRYMLSHRPPPASTALPYLTLVIFNPDSSISIHSMALDPIISEDERPTTLKSVICSYPNQTLWNDLDLDGDGKWIVDGLARGSLAIVHNSSFSAAERTDKHTASNYRGELLGNLMAALILKAASSLLLGDAHPAVVACDNSWQ
jgi:hypothetical protein